jgi:hypothetical protein
MLKKELIKLAEEKKKIYTKEDYKKLPTLHRFGSSLGAGFLGGIPSSIIGPTAADIIQENLAEDLTKHVIEKNLTENQVKNMFRNLGLQAGSAILGSLASQFMAMGATPDSAVSKYAPVVGAVSSLPLAYGLISKAPKRAPAVLALTGASALASYLTRRIKKYFYERALKKRKK